MSYNVVRNVSSLEYIQELITRYPEITVTRTVIKKESNIELMNHVNQNSNISPESSGKNIHSENQNDIIEIISDTDDDTEQLEAIQIAPIVNLKRVNQNLNITPESSGKNIDSENQNDIIEIISDTDDDTEQLEAIQIAPIVNLKCVHFIRDRKTTFPSYYKKEIFNNLIKMLKDKPESYDLKPPMATTQGYPLRVKDLMTILTPKGWLNDSVIQNYIALLVNKYCEKTLELNTDFVNSYNQGGFDSVYSWFKKYDLNNINRVVVPINPGSNHWALLVIDIWIGQIYCFDSYTEFTCMEECISIFKFLVQAIDHFVIHHSGVQRTTPLEWEYTIVKSPKQENNNDCGLFTCINARYFLTNTPPSEKFSQKYMPILRQIIAWEILNGELECF